MILTIHKRTAQNSEKYRSDDPRMAMLNQKTLVHPRRTLLHFLLPNSWMRYECTAGGISRYFEQKEKEDKLKNLISSLHPKITTLYLIFHYVSHN